MPLSPRLTPLLREQILASIRAGGYPHVAAQAWGVCRATFDAWLVRRRGRGPHAGFAAAVHQAHAQARLRAEVEVCQGDGRYWLEHGPGRETANRPGWSSSVKAAETFTEAHNVLLQADAMALLNDILTELESFPEARVHLAKMADTKKPQAKPIPDILRRLHQEMS